MSSKSYVISGIVCAVVCWETEEFIRGKWPSLLKEIQIHAYLWHNKEENNKYMLIPKSISSEYQSEMYCIWYGKALFAVS